MKEYYNRMSLLPRRVRSRMIMSYALMGVIPILAGVYAITVHIANRMIAEWMSIVFMVCIALSCLGFIVMRATVMSIIDVFNTLDADLPVYGSNNPNKLTDEDIVQFEHMVIYMENQIHRARNRIEEYRSSAPVQTLFRLPPLVPRNALRKRIVHELTRAETNNDCFALFALKEHTRGAEKTIDESRIPSWTEEILRNTTATFDGIGLWHDGLWLLWIKKQTGDETQLLENKIAGLIPAAQADNVTIKAWNHPCSSLTRDAILEILDAMGAEG